MKPNTDSSDSEEEDGDFMIKNSEYEEEDGDFISQTSHSPRNEKIFPPTIEKASTQTAKLLESMNINDSEDDGDFNLKESDNSNDEEEDFELNQANSNSTTKQKESETPQKTETKKSFADYMNSIDDNSSEDDGDFQMKESDNSNEEEEIESNQTNSNTQKEAETPQKTETKKSFADYMNSIDDNSSEDDEDFEYSESSKKSKQNKSKVSEYFNLDADYDDDYDDSKKTDEQSKKDDKNDSRKIADLLSKIIELTTPHKTVGEALINSHDENKTQQITSTATELLFLGKLDIYYKDIEVLRGEQSILANMK